MYAPENAAVFRTSWEAPARRRVVTSMANLWFPVTVLMTSMVGRMKNRKKKNNFFRAGFDSTTPALLPMRGHHPQQFTGESGTDGVAGTRDTSKKEDRSAPGNCL